MLGTYAMRLPLSLAAAALRSACAAIPPDPVHRLDIALGGDRLLVRVCLPLETPRPRLGACRMDRSR